MAINASFSDHLVMADGFTKGDTLVGVTGGIFKCTFGETYRAPH